MRTATFQVDLIARDAHGARLVVRQVFGRADDAGAFVSDRRSRLSDGELIVVTRIPLGVAP